ncbi:MAG: hypothetical protein JSV25_09405 [Spirochaetota bacterium]|nr:MAG: hypothetical protein JSV25_09405 [Spirochaetota bacterium]
MDLKGFIQRFIYESDEARIDDLFNSINMYLNEIQDIRKRVASIHLLIRRLRDLSTEYQKLIKQW